MYNFYEIRNKATHRIEFMGLFAADQKPDEVFKADPASKVFAGRLDLYINIAKEETETLEQAQSFLQQKLIDYKLVKVEEEIPVVKVARPKKTKGK
jgi:hypothetical protein